MTASDETKARLEYLRGQIDAECISYGEIAELQGLAAEIDPSDVQLLEWAGVPEFPEQCEHGYSEGCPDCDVASHFPAVLGAGLSGRLTEVVEDDDGFVPCPVCGVNRVDPEFTGADGRSVCDDCREGAA